MGIEDGIGTEVGFVEIRMVGPTTDVRSYEAGQYKK